MRDYHIPYGENDKHAEKLKLGISKMVPGFSAYVCELCGGTGQRKQMYTAGCGGGYYHSMGDCEYCYAGLCQGSGFINPAAPSVLYQVLVAAESV